MKNQLLNFGVAKRAVATLSSLTPTYGRPLRASRDLAKQLAEHAEAFTGVPAFKVMGRGRPADVSLVRQVIMFLIREACGATWMETGEAFSRDHGTAMHAHAKVRTMLKIEIEHGSGRRPTAELIRQLCEAMEMRVPRDAAEKPGL